MYKISASKISQHVFPRRPLRLPRNEMFQGDYCSVWCKINWPSNNLSLFTDLPHFPPLRGKNGPNGTLVEIRPLWCHKGRWYLFLVTGNHSADPALSHTTCLMSPSQHDTKHLSQQEAVNKGLNIPFSREIHIEQCCYTVEFVRKNEYKIKSLRLNIFVFVGC